MDRGRLYLAARQFDRAEDEGNFILKQDPKEVGAYQLLGAALMGEQKSDAALTAFSKVTELLPKSASAYVNMALVEINLHRLTDAEQHLRTALTVDPKATQAYSDLATFYRLENRIAEAQQVLEAGVEKNANGFVLYLDLASMLASQGKKDEAEAFVDKLRKRLPTSTDAAMAIGDFYFQRKQTDQAVAEYRRGLSVSAKNLDIEKRIQDLYLSTGQIQLAADLDRGLIKDAPKDVVVRIDHGRLLMAQGKLADAIANFQKVVADATDSAQAHYFLGMAYWQNGELAQASVALSDALKVSPGLPITLQALVRLNLAQGNPSNAQSFAQELVQKFPTDPVNHQLLAEVLARQGQLRLAEERIFIANRLAPNDPIIRLNLARIYSAEKKWTEAQKEFESAFQLDPHNTAILEQWAAFWTARNQSAQALSRVQQYVAANPNDARGHVILGTLGMQLKNYSTAQAELERAIQIDPKNVQAYLQLGEVYEAEGQIDIAISRYQNALDLQPTRAKLATMVGNLYLKKGDLETARKYYAKVLATDPDFAVANANMAWVDAQEGKDLDVALGMAQKAKSQMPQVVSVTDTLAWVMYKKGNYAGAVPLLKECVQKSPESAVYHYHLGLTLMATGQKAQAKEQLKTALEMKLENADAQQAQKMVVAE